MKIKTITCHEVYNYGASLQEYALLIYLKTLGHEAETIHYKPPYLSKHFKLNDINNEFFSKNIIFKLIYIILKLPKRLINLKRKKKFDEFSLNHIKSTKTLYKSNENLKSNIPSADAYICGSDQIWNSFFENGKDPAFYLDFVPDNKLKISYAASFAIDELEQNIKAFVKEKVSRLNHISVRESSGKKILNELGITSVTQVLDPVFLLESETWSELINVDKESEKYVFIYDFDSNPLIKIMAKKCKTEYGWKIITVNELINYADRNYFLEGPIKFLSLVKNAEFVISNSFHAVAFSIIFKKEFVVFNRHDKINTRMRDLLASIGQNQLLIQNEDMVKNHKFNNIDFKYVQKCLDSLIETSTQFLKNALKTHG
ncbi:polysaccharide pyruvyl transferase [Mariniflexile fucanivorans]|uniref:Polysaccharide pyruvyl transferase n=1 Tax=Mariniflexile fucanivorans TaxID=264023 RepID=A0A4R1RHE7_9FLAO|nr:polysaccharide pyruvyl transferase family protein [Mariniflexile fucanivorans]TCL65012.1 polysaccharide pyruvyl transferase [Mariniflexile fucanivorans]